MTDPIKLRETWLTNLAADMMPAIAAIAAEYETEASGPYRFPAVKVTCGWPHKGGMAKRRVRGECWDTSASEGNYAEIFISPMESDANEVAHILSHELVHALLGTATGHRQPFPAIVKAMGLEGKATATTAGPDAPFWDWAGDMVAKQGEYPHAKLSGTSGKKKSKTYLLKASCPECDYTVRVTQKHIDAGGLPCCPSCSDYESGYIVPMVQPADAGEDA